MQSNLNFEIVVNFTDLEQIKAALADVIVQQQETDLELEKLLAGEEDLKKDLAVLVASRGRMDDLSAEASHLSKSVLQTCQTAETISRKVRELDTAQSRLNVVIKKVGDAIDLKDTISGLKSSMASGDFETAASHVHRYLQFDHAIIDEGAAQILQEETEKLRGLVREKCDEAVRADNQKEILRFCKLFAPLGLDEDGLKHYTNYLRGVITRELNEELTEISAGKKGPKATMLYFNATRKLLEDTIKLLGDHEQVIVGQFGARGMSSILKSLYQLCEDQFDRVLKKMRESYKLPKLVRDITAYMTSTGGGESKRINFLDAVASLLMLWHLSSDDYLLSPSSD
eukprot:TRINITY_DN5566_c0_g1_i2.p1 TRINITY_DN5566_c0_g1~~TRINITY_DN5566_c0_g1_i2.p1  ORF type:complete len:342 (-),score=75.41 TRINITY_DN5566_c0_g1_i2:7-1032(-)